MLRAFVDTNVLLRLLVGDDAAQHRTCVALLQRARKESFALRVLPVVLLEVVGVLERVQQCPRAEIRWIVEAILNTPEFEVESEAAFRKALPAYESTGVKFADALMAHWGIELGLTTVHTFDEEHFRRIPGLEVRRP